MSWENVLKDKFISINSPSMNSKRLKNAIDALFEGVGLDELQAEQIKGANPSNPNQLNIILRAELFLKELLEENEEYAKRIAEKVRQRQERGDSR